MYLHALFHSQFMMPYFLSDKDKYFYIRKTSHSSSKFCFDWVLKDHTQKPVTWIPPPASLSTLLDNQSVVLAIFFAWSSWVKPHALWIIKQLILEDCMASQDSVDTETLLLTGLMMRSSWLLNRQQHKGMRKDIQGTCTKENYGMAKHSFVCREHIPFNCVFICCSGLSHPWVKSACSYTFHP